MQIGMWIDDEKPLLAQMGMDRLFRPGASRVELPMTHSQPTQRGRPVLIQRIEHERDDLPNRDRRLLIVARQDVRPREHVEFSLCRQRVQRRGDVRFEQAHCGLQPTNRRLQIGRSCTLTPQVADLTRRSARISQTSVMKSRRSRLQAVCISRARAARSPMGDSS